MEFIMHDSGLHYYEPPKKYLVFLNTEYKNKEGFNKIKIKSAAKAWEIQSTLIFTTDREVNWII